jgi:hypothetical protein
MKQKSSIITSVLIIVLMCLMGSTAHAFTAETNRTMIDDAVVFCPKPLQTYLDSNVKTIKDGMNFINRNYDIKTDPDLIENFYSRLVCNLKNGKEQDYNTMRLFGLLASCIGELNNPSGKSARNKGNYTLLQASERDVNGHIKVSQKWS